MKHLLISLLILATGWSADAQSNHENLDKGFEMLRIDAKRSGLEKYLVATPAEELWSKDAADISEDGIITSGWVFDHKKAGLLTYHGLRIARIEVYFGWNQEFSDEGEPIGEEFEDIYSFKLYLDPPANDKQREQFSDGIFGLYGDFVPVFDELTGDVAGFLWFSEITMLTALMNDAETGAILKYYEVMYNQGYGG